jgi:hypothetical protein
MICLVWVQEAALETGTPATHASHDATSTSFWSRLV